MRPDEKRLGQDALILVLVLVATITTAAFGYTGIATIVSLTAVCPLSFVTGARATLSRLHDELEVIGDDG
jgi:hypothetical protein